MEYTVKLEWDDEAAVWVATSDDVRGLVLESGSLDALIEKVRYAVPELLELNHMSDAGRLHFMAERYMEALVCPGQSCPDWYLKI